MVVVDEKRLRSTDIDVLVRDAVFGAPAVRDFARWLIGSRPDIGRPAGQHPRILHCQGPGRMVQPHSARHEHPLLHLRHWPGCPACWLKLDQHPGLHLRDCPQRDGLHRSGTCRICHQSDRRRHQRGLPRPALHPGRSLPGQSLHLQKDPGCGHPGSQRPDRQSHPCWLLEHRHRH